MPKSNTLQTSQNRTEPNNFKAVVNCDIGSSGPTILYCFHMRSGVIFKEYIITWALVLEVQEKFVTIAKTPYNYYLYIYTDFLPPISIGNNNTSKWN